MKIPFLILLVILSVCSVKLDPKKIIVSINCGSSLTSVPSSDSSYKYQTDKKYVTGQSVQVDYHSNTEALDADIKFSFEKELFLYQRHTYNQMTYSLPLKQGFNTLIMKFAEVVDYLDLDKRVFDIKIGSKTIVKDLDVFAKTGTRFGAHQEYIEINLKENEIYINGEKIQKGYQNGKLKLTFIKGKADNPIIQGIIVYHSPINESPKEQYLKLRNNWQSQQEMKKAILQQKKIKQLIERQNKKQKIVIRNDQIVIEDNTSNNAPTPTPQKYGLIRLFLMSPVGIIIWAVAYISVIWFLKEKIFKLGISDKSNQKNK